ncbi:MAG: sugar ABC transporter permease [Actinomycetia bacterium]|nr:sugar ABC transporter permease [Actinomycetes bacterium]
MAETATARRDADAQSRARTRRRRLPLLPALIFLIVVTQVPFVVTLVISFAQWNIQYPNDRKLGTVANYLAVLKDPTMRDAVLNTVVMVVATLVICLVAGMVLALLLNRQFFGRGIVRTLLITPFLIMPMAASLMWKHLIYNPEYGIIHGFSAWFADLTGQPTPHTDLVSQSPMTAIIIALAWTWTPFMFLILLAGLQSQDPDIHEAAAVDGAGTWATFRYLTLPMLRPYIELCLVLGVIYLLNAYDHVFTITQGGPGTATTNLPYAIYLTAYRGYDYGEASAAGVLVVALSVLLATFGLRMVSSLADDSAPTKEASR